VAARLAAALCLVAAVGAAHLPASTLAIRAAGRWHPWWRSSAAPTQWTGPHPGVAGAVRWRRAANGAEWGELRLAGNGEAWRTKVVVVRLDPTQVRLALDTAFTAGGERPAWTIERARPDAVVAINAGQFPRTLPWGWVMLDGREMLAPGRGPLSTAVAIDSAGAVHWISGDSLAEPAAAARARRGIVTAFQSYPMLLAGGTVPPALRARGLGVDLAHRDARLALGTLADGRIVVALTRFDGAGDALDFLPFGLTVPEMAALMGALGARDAVMLDGGISSQMLIRPARGAPLTWRGLRTVPLALIATPR
jgi:exopolysaccharide biosynthesis protein